MSRKNWKQWSGEVLEEKGGYLIANLGELKGVHVMLGNPWLKIEKIK